MVFNYCQQKQNRIKTLMGLTFNALRQRHLGRNGSTNRFPFRGYWVQLCWESNKPYNSINLVWTAETPDSNLRLEASALFFEHDSRGNPNFINFQTLNTPDLRDISTQNIEDVGTTYSSVLETVLRQCLKYLDQGEHLVHQSNGRTEDISSCPRKDIILRNIDAAVAVEFLGTHTWSHDDSSVFELKTTFDCLLPHYSSRPICTAAVKKQLCQLGYQWEVHYLPQNKQFQTIIYRPGDSLSVEVFSETEEVGLCLAVLPQGLRMHFLGLLSELELIQ